jgi:hypothetical protein
VKQLAPASKYERLSYLLGKYGEGAITEAEFWRQMRESKLGQDDIDQWCEEYHSRQLRGVSS